MIRVVVGTTRPASRAQRRGGDDRGPASRKHHAELRLRSGAGEERPIRDRPLSAFSQALARLDVAITTDDLVYAYAPPGFGLATLVRSAAQRQDRTLVLVRAPLDERDLARAQETTARPDDFCVVVDDPTGHVGPGDAAELAITLGRRGLVVLGRTPRPEWDASQTSTVLRPVDLLADPPETGDPVDARAAGRWPALVDIHAHADPAVAAAEVRTHVRRQWWPHVPEAWHPTLAVLVASGRLRPEGERAALPGLDPVVLDDLLDLGVVEPHPSGTGLRIVPALGEVVADCLPAEVEQARDDVSRMREHLGTEDAGLAAAAHRGDWAACARIIDRWWPELMAAGHRALIQRVTLDLPDRALSTFPGIALQAELLGRLPVGAVPLDDVRPATPHARLAGTEAGVVALRRTVIAMVGRRVHGRLAEARTLALDTEPFVDACRRADLGPTVASTPLWYLHAGLSCHLADDQAGAGRLYRKGWQLREKDDLGLVARELATKIALLRASGGRPVEARRWLENTRQAPAVAGAVSSSATVSEHAARLMIALDGADLGAFDRVWEELGDSYVRDEMWPVVVSAVAGRRLAGGDVDGVLHTLAEVPGVYPDTAAAGGLPTAVMGLLGAEAFLAAGRATEAQAALEALPRTPAVQVLRALLAAVAGDLEEARHVLASTDVSGATRRDRLRLSLVSVVAHHRQGHDLEAAAILEDVARFARRGRLPMLLATVPREDLEALVDRAPTARALLQELDDRGVQLVVPAHVELVTLSERERVVLEALVEHDTNDGIARALFVSVNTVKTQLRAVYAKLGVNNRREAVLVARERGLLGRRPEPPVGG